MYVRLTLQSGQLFSGSQVSLTVASVFDFMALVRKVLKRWLKILGISLTVIVLALLNFVAVEHIHCGRVGLNLYLKTLKAKGEELSFEKLEPQRFHWRSARTLVLP